MTIGCSGELVTVQPFCTPECTRWTQVNAGEPIRIYHDTSNWDPNCRPSLNEPDPQVYLDEALATWEWGYPCGQLFEMVDDPTLAQVIVVHDVNQFGEPQGTASCVCDEEDDVCVRQADHSQVFTAQNPAVLTMYCQPGTDLPVDTFIRIWVHELGHILGMGHVYGLPVDSVMGTITSIPPDGTLRDFDLEQLQNRYPCDCVLTNNFTQFIEPEQINQTSDFCPGCQGI